MKMAQAQVPVKFWDIEIDTIGNKETREVIEKYIKNLNTMYRDGWGLYLTGSNGIGKTMIAGLVLKEAIRKGHSALFTSLSEVISIYSNTTYSREDRKSLYTDKILGTDFLVLDDIDKTYHSANSNWVDAICDDVFRQRANRSLPVIVTANKTKKTLLDQDNFAFGTDLLSLFAETVYEVHVRGKDRRNSVLQKRMGEFFNGF